MHSAPAVSYPVGRSRLYGGLLVLTSLTSLLAGLLWRYQAHPPAWQQGFFALILFVTGLAAFQDWRRSACGSLKWDGQGWSLLLPGATFDGSLSARLDLQRSLLLCLRSAGGRRHWMWLECRSDAPIWSALRRAVFAGNSADCVDQAGVIDQRVQVKS